ncbi:sulfatase-like hydrolase/transferase, partial [bacterium]|nr:sulfatase-like hydrolase/transferase [bacterium]
MVRTQSFGHTLSQGAIRGMVGGLCIFVCEWFLTKFHAEISFRTYGFFLTLYLLGGLFGGAVLAWILRVLSDRLQAVSANRSFMAAGLLATIFFLYGFYYLNEKLTPGVGMFAPISLAATGIHFGFSVLIFLLVTRISRNSADDTLSYVGLVFLPMAALVGLNFRFFLWHSPNTDTPELFMAAVGFGAVGTVATCLALLFVNPSTRSGPLRPALSVALGFACLTCFSISGTPSGASYQVSAAKPPGRVEAVHKNVIWIVMDTARRDQISIYGEHGKLTPNIDTFAKDALVMEKAISSAPWTIPSHASMFTGMFPSKHAAHRGVPGGRFTNPLASEHVTIAEILQSYGYDTAAVAGNVAGLSRSFGFSQGFNYYFDGRPIAFNLFLGRALMAIPKGIRARLL